MKCKHCGEADGTVAGLDSIQCLHHGPPNKTTWAEANAMPPPQDAKKPAAKKAAAAKKG